MGNTDWEGIIYGFMILIAVSIILGSAVGGTYIHKKIKVDNFQATILDLSAEQKCIHICGFEFHGFLESYKFCMEKCDRISERLADCEVR